MSAVSFRSHPVDKPVIEVSHDTHVTHLIDNYWRIDVVTHIFTNGYEIAQGMVSHTFMEDHVPG